MTRRKFVSTAVAAWGASAIAATTAAAQNTNPPLLPTVRWGKHDITRLLVGHNPIKGMSHVSDDLNREMRQWFADDPSRGQDMLRRCQQLGLNACQLGFRTQERGLIENLLHTHYRNGGTLKWIASFYSPPTDRDAAKEELSRIIQMNPRPIGIQQVGNTADALFKQGKTDQSTENLKLFRDAGLLVGLGSHNHEVIDYAESKGWDLDFYQCSFYRSVFGPNPPRKGEIFDDPDRAAMTKTIRQVSKPCIAFKVLASSRHCATPQSLEAALRFAFENIKSTDIVLLGMWQKHQDQVAQNTAIVRRILNVA